MAFLAFFNQIYLFCRTLIVSLKVNTTHIIISPEYSDLVEVFFPEPAVELLEHTNNNHDTIDLVNGKQPLYRSIYSSRPVELETLKTYIKTNLTNSFIRPSKSFVGALILFIWKLDDGGCPYVNYWGLNNLTIKNCYLLSVICKSLD